MELILDPLNSINEIYSSKDGSLRVDGETENSEKTTLQITGEPSDGGPPGGEGLGPIWVTIIIIGTVSIAIIISSFGILKPRIKKRTALKRQLKIAKADIKNFENQIRSFIKAELKDVYKDNWWEKGIPDYIKKSIDKRKLALKSKKSQMPIEDTSFLDLIHLSSVITTDKNWESTFSNTFPSKRIIEENFENVRMFEQNLNEGIVSSEELNKYPLYIHAIRNYFTRGFNVFLSMTRQIHSFPLILP